jgi:hypothetical protein
VPRGEEGCTPGFWKNHPEDYPEGYTSDMLVGDVFADAPGELAGLTLQEGLELGGGQENALLRHAIAAVLNAASGGVDFALTVEEVVEMVNAAFRGEEDVEATKDILEGFNEAGCPL